MAMAQHTGCSQTDPLRPGLRLLIADDNTAMRALLVEMFRPVARECVEAESGEAAVRECSQRAFDMVLMDVRMPLLDGIEAAARISRMHPETLIVMVTEYDDEEYREAARRAGAVRYFLKENLRQLDYYIKSQCF